MASLTSKPKRRGAAPFDKIERGYWLEVVGFNVFLWLMIFMLFRLIV